MKLMFLTCILFLSRVSSKGMIEEEQEVDLLEMKVNTFSFTMHFQVFATCSNLFSDNVASSICRDFY